MPQLVPSQVATPFGSVEQGSQRDPQEVVELSEEQPFEQRW
jgi:hypothetical protein